MAQIPLLLLAVKSENRKTLPMKTTTVSGFTLLEMVVVIALVAVLSMGSWQGWQRWQQLQQLNDSARQVQRLLIRIRTDAWWHNTDRSVWLMSGDPWCMGSGTVVKNCDAPARLQLLAPWPDVSVSALTSEMRFYGRKNTARPGSIVIVSPSGERRIIVSSRGRVRICPQSETLCR